MFCVRLSLFIIKFEFDFAIFAAFKESMTLNLAQRAFKVIDFGTNRKRVYIFLLVVNNNLDPILGRLKLQDRKMQDWKLTDKNYRGWKMTDSIKG